MCGINLVFNTDNKPIKAETLKRMNNAIMHRGPDENGVFIQDGVGVGHVRLSIVDVKNGKQPMHSADDRYCIVFNGEIYNFEQLRNDLIQTGFKFNTRTDTEVILALYQQYREKCLGYLHGMFSFAVYDKINKSVFIARDRLGIKPLFYHWNGQQLIAASEIKAIFASTLVEPVLNQQSIMSHFKYQFSISPNTMFTDIFELPPGHFVKIDQENDFKPTEYWNIEFPENNEYETDDSKYWHNEFEEALHKAAANHLIGDVPIGTYLSGGLDSSTMAFLLKQHYPKNIQSFSIHFDNPDSDESYAYRPVAQHFDISNSELLMEDNRSEGYFSTLKDCLYHLEQPQRMAVDIPHFLLSDFVRQQDYKVVYTGDGADEILAGYDCFRQDSMRVAGNNLHSEKARQQLYFSEYTQYFATQHMTMLLSHHQPEYQKNIKAQFGCYPAWYDFWHILDQTVDKLFLNNNSDDNQLIQFAESIKPHIENRHSLNQSLYWETKTRLPGWILWKSDRLSMAHGIEARVPFMDHELVELAARIPPNLKLKDMDEKHILKNIMSPHLPNIQGNYKKRAFYTPIKEWLFSDIHQEALAEYLSKQQLEECGIFNPDTVEKLLNELNQMPLPTDMNSYYQSMQLEWSLMLVLSTQMLHRLFVAKEARCFHDIT